MRLLSFKDLCDPMELLRINPYSKKLKFFFRKYEQIISVEHEKRHEVYNSSYLSKRTYFDVIGKYEAVYMADVINNYAKRSSETMIDKNREILFIKNFNEDIREVTLKKQNLWMLQ